MIDKILEYLEDDNNFYESLILLIAWAVINLLIIL